MVRRSRFKRLRSRLSPDFIKIARELQAKGEMGRAVPGVDQARIRANVPDDSAAIPAPEGRGDISTFFTQAGGETQLYQAESWVYLNLLLLDAGPVAVGTRENIAPVLSGKGGLLVQNETFRFPVRAGQRVFITANTVGRVRVTVEPVPLGAQILKLLASILGKG